MVKAMPRTSPAAVCARTHRGGVGGSSRNDKRLPGIDIPTLKEQGIDVELANWRAVFAAPDITDAQRKDLIDLMSKTVKTPAWQATLKKNEWEDLFLAGDAFKAFLDKDQTRIAKIIESVGLVKK
jgi:putative tricarboxylic transport membrane protein